VSRSRRLEIGVVGLLTLAAASTFGPVLLPKPPAADPARSALLPPASSVTEITLVNGRRLVSPNIRQIDAAVIVSGTVRDTEIPDDEIQSMQTRRFWLGSDRFGRDVLHQLLLGGRVSLSIAGLAAIVALLAGTTVGLAAATGGRLADGILMRLVDGLLAFPVLFLLILVAAVFRPGPGTLVMVLGLTSWMGVARLVRGQVMSLRRRTFVLAARAAGARPWRIWRSHFLANLAGPLSQDTALRVGDLVIAEATLSFLGLGVPPDVPSWGAMVAQGQRVMLDGWWLATLPGFAIAALVVSLALVGDGLQERVAGDNAGTGRHERQ
jgi:peptide/nickel transport system permease protein